MSDLGYCGTKRRPPSNLRMLKRPALADVGQLAYKADADAAEPMKHVASTLQQAAVLERNLQYVTNKQKTEYEDLGTRLSNLVQFVDKTLDATRSHLLQINEAMQQVKGEVVEMEAWGFQTSHPFKALAEIRAADIRDWPMRVIARKGEPILLIYPMQEIIHDGVARIVMRFKKAHPHTAAIETGWVIIRESGTQYVSNFTCV